MGSLSFADGRHANVVLVGPRQNTKAATLVLPAEAGEGVRTLPLVEGLDLLHPETVIDVVCMQERVFGQAGLEPPPELGEPS